MTTELSLKRVQLRRSRSRTPFRTLQQKHRSRKTNSDYCTQTVQRMSRKQEIAKKDTKKDMVKKKHLRQKNTTMSLRSSTIFLVRSAFSVTVFDVKNTRRLTTQTQQRRLNLMASSSSAQPQKLRPATAQQENKIRKSLSQSEEFRVSNSESQTQSAQGNLREIKTEKFITEVYLKQRQAERRRTATLSSISHSASDASPRVPQALRVIGSTLRRSDPSNLESECLSISGSDVGSQRLRAKDSVSESSAVFL